MSTKPKYRCTECDALYRSFNAAARCHWGIGGVDETKLCQHCGKHIYADHLGTLIDVETGGDVCGSYGTYTNEPHQPKDTP